MTELIIFYIGMFILGAVFGSFACCQAWRLHEKPKKLGSRSICMNCKSKLAWYDNIPIISWLLLRGKCRKCKAKIGVSELFSEIGLGLAFLGVSIAFSNTCLDSGFSCVISLPFYPDFLFLILTLVIFTIYWIILIFDAKWGELPVSLMIIEIILAILAQFISPTGDILSVLMSIGILSGIYYLLYKFSKERWVGGGDWILCISIAIILGNPILALIELFLANTLAALYSVPILILKKDNHIPLGPFLIIALILIIIFSVPLSNFLYLTSYTFGF